MRAKWELSSNYVRGSHECGFVRALLGYTSLLHVIACLAALAGLVLVGLLVLGNVRNLRYGR